MARERVAFMPSDSNPAATPYTVSKHDSTGDISNAGYECGCPAWTRKRVRVNCKHIERFIAACDSGHSANLTLTDPGRRIAAARLANKTGRSVATPRPVVPSAPASRPVTPGRSAASTLAERVERLGGPAAPRPAAPAPAPVETKPTSTQMGCELCGKKHTGFCKGKDFADHQKALKMAEAEKDPLRFKLLEVD